MARAAAPANIDTEHADAAPLLEKIVVYCDKKSKKGYEEDFVLEELEEAIELYEQNKELDK